MASDESKDGGWDSVVEEAENMERTGPGHFWLQRAVTVLRSDIWIGARRINDVQDLSRACGATGLGALDPRARAQLEKARPLVKEVLLAQTCEYSELSDKQVDRVTMLVCRIHTLCCAEGPGDGDGFGVGLCSRTEESGGVEPAERAPFEKPKALRQNATSGPERTGPCDRDWSEKAETEASAIINDFGSAVVVDRRENEAKEEGSGRMRTEHGEIVEWGRITIDSGCKIEGHGGADLLVPTRKCMIDGIAFSPTVPCVLYAAPWAALEVVTENGEPVEFRCVNAPNEPRNVMAGKSWRITDADGELYYLGSGTFSK